MLLEKELNQISVTEICAETGLNRSTFYSNYTDVYDLADKLRKKTEADFSKAFSDKTTHSAENFFDYICRNQIMFKTYFKLGYDKKHRSEIGNWAHTDASAQGKNIYHVTFFQSGLNAVITQWLDGGCAESPKEMAEAIKDIYGKI